VEAVRTNVVTADDSAIAILGPRRQRPDRHRNRPATVGEVASRSFLPTSCGLCCRA